MKRLLTILILVLTYQTPSQADDIRDFQIEGMSVGDSLLDYFGKERIESYKTPYPKSDKFYNFETIESKYQVYKNVQFDFKKNDEKYIIYSIGGGIFYKDIKKCNKKKEEVVSEIKEIVEEQVKVEYFDKYPHSPVYPNSTVESVEMYFKSGDIVRVYCLDWSEKVTEEKNWSDHLAVNISTKAYREFIDNEAYD